MERETSEPEDKADRRRQQQGATTADIANIAGDIVYTVHDGVSAGDLTSGGIEAFKTVSRAITNAEKQAAGAILDGIRSIPDTAGSVWGFAGNAMDTIVDGARSAGGGLPGASGLLDAAGEAAALAARTATRAANSVTSTAGAMDAAQLASLPGALAETVVDAIGTVTRSAVAVEPILSAGTQAGGVALELAAKGAGLAVDAAGVVASAAQHIDVGAVVQATTDVASVAVDVASVAGEVGVHIIEAVVDGLSSLS